MKFIHNLDGMSEPEVQAYLGELSQHIGLKPEWNALDVVWMPQEDGTKHRVPYARRGTTEMLREIHRIEIISIEPLDIPGTATFRVTAKKIDTGRKEISIGSHTIEGLKGKHLDAAIMTAQTRGCRRVTLQFIGAGLLDETEISPVADVKSTASLAELAGSAVVIPPSPVAQPNTQPGVDITLKTPEQQAAQAVLDKMAQPAAQTAPETPSEDAKKPRRPRKPRGAVDILSPGQTASEPPQKRELASIDPVVPSLLAKPVQTEMPAGQIDNKGIITPIVASAVPKEVKIGGVGSPDDYQAPAPIFAPQVMVPAPPVSPELENALKQVQAAPTIPEDKLKQYRDRLNIFATTVLPKAGMVSTEGIGGVTMKLRKFALSFTQADTTQKLTEQQWEDLLTFLDTFLAQNGPEALVAYINKSVGA